MPDRDGRKDILHDGKTTPLHGDLKYSQKPSKACKSRVLRATCNIGSTSGQRQDIRERGRLRGRSEQHKVRRYSFR